MKNTAKQLTKQQIIKETAQTYNIHKRAESGRGGCTYLNLKTLNKCAVGRCIKPEKIVVKAIAEHEASVYSLNWDFPIEEILEERYKGHELDFWNDLQLFHDEKTFWGESGVSKEGRIRKNLLLKRWGNK